MTMLGQDEYKDAMSEAAEARQERWQSEVEDSGSIRDGIAKAFYESKRELTEEREFESALDERHELRERSGGSLPKIVEGYAALHKWGKQDPQAAAQWTVDWALKQPEVHIQPRKSAQSEDSGPRHISDDVRDAVRAVKENAADRAALKTLKELAPGQSPLATLKEINRFDRALREDPIGTVARHAARAGVPVLPHQQEREARVQSFQSFIDEVAASGVLPNFRELQGAMEGVLRDPGFHRTGDPRTDLFNAYQVAEQRAVAAARRKAAVSLKGSGPGGGASEGKRSVRDDIMAAVAAMDPL